MIAGDALAIFARAPQPGQAKTRLIPRLGAEGAAQLQARLIELALAKAAALSDCATTLWLDGDAALLPPPARAVPRQTQRGADLGERMADAFARTLRTARRMVLIGTDCPGLTPADLHAAFAALARHEVVVQPALDGGYVLIGLAAPQPQLFDGIRWGSDEVLAATRERIAALGLRAAWLAPRPDLDTPTDYEHALAQGWI
jgi:rSAM/selenodomain-associated transferase 1